MNASAQDPRSGLFPLRALSLVLVVTAACAPQTTAPSDAGADVQARDLVDASDRAEVSDLPDVGDRPDAGGADAGSRDVVVARDVADAGLPDVILPDAGWPWGLDARPVNRTCVAFPAPSAGGSVRAVPAFPRHPGANQFTTMLQRPGDNARWYFTHQSGVIYRIQNTADVSATSVALDFHTSVAFGGEAGFLGMAFHPAFATNGWAYLSYTRPLRAGESGVFISRISRVRSRDGGDTFDAATEEVVLELSQPFTNHNGGGIMFGPDGYLYAGFGDGGSGGDPMLNGQNPNTLLGKFLRVDVDRPSGGRTYGIPADNPYAAGGGRPEIFATGLRNPWRWSFDRATGDLWAGDVGQGAREEVDVIRRGGDYGWSTMEGFTCYRGTPCASGGTALPVLDYPRSDGVSIIGGFVYRGRAMPWLAGRFIFGDYGSGRVWAVTFDAAGVASKETLVETGTNLYTFGQDQEGEVYVVPISGAILRLVPATAAPEDRVPRTLRATGCVDPTDPLRPAEGLIPYAPSAPFWSDGAGKERFMALPESGRITVGSDGDWDLPNGTVLMKNFTVGTRRVETRLFVRHADGAWRGYTYRWNDAQTDADLLDGSEVRDLGGGARWYYPSRTQCLECHSAAAGRSLGLESAQLNTALRYPNGRVSNQLDTLDHIGLFATPLPPPAMRPAAYPDPYAPGPDEPRARAYLHTNCSQCHRPGGIGRGAMDLRFATPFATTGTCNAAPMVGSLGIADARLVAPGAPARSVVHARVTASDVSRMPPVSSGVVDTAGAALLNRWIASLTRCP